MGRQKQNRHKERQQPLGVDLMAALFGTPTRESIRRQEQQQAQSPFYDSDEYLENSESDEESSTEDDSVAWSEDIESDQESDRPRTSRLEQKSSSKKKTRSRSTTRPKSSEKSRAKMISPEKSSRASRERASVSPKRSTSARTVHRSPSKKHKNRKHKKVDSPPPAKTPSYHLPQGQQVASSRGTSPPSVPHPVPQAVPGYPPVYTTTPFPVLQPIQGFQHLQPTQIAPETQNILAPLSQPPPIFAQPAQHQAAPILTYPQAPLAPVGIPACSSSNSISQKLSILQSEIDQKEKEVAARPHDVVLNYQLHTLRHEINKTLNEAMTSPSQATCSPCSHKHSTASFEGEDGPSKFTTPVKNKTSRARTKSNQHEGRAQSEALCSEAVLMGQRAESPEPSVKYHVCFGCGSVRSAKYHDSHPVDPGQGPIRNICSNCRDAMMERGVIGSRHICFGCGIVRSKRFHKAHPVKKGEALLPNYCATCVSEMRTSETTVDCSVVGEYGHVLRSNEIGSASKNYLDQSRQEIASSNKGKGVADSVVFSKESKRKSPREHRVREGSKSKEKLARPKANVSETSNKDSMRRKMKYSPPRVEDLTSNLSIEQKLFRQGTESAFYPNPIGKSSAGGYSYDGPGNLAFSGLEPANDAPRRDIPEDEQVLNGSNRSSFRNHMNYHSWGNLDPNLHGPEDGTSFARSNAEGFESGSSPTSAASPATYHSSSQDHRSPKTEHILPRTTGGAFSADAGFDPTSWNFSATSSWATKGTPKSESHNPSPNRDFRPDDQSRKEESSGRDYHKSEKADGSPRTPQIPRSPFLREPNNFGPAPGDQTSPPFSTNTPGGHHFPETAPSSDEEPVYPREGKRSYNWYHGSVPGPDSKSKPKPKPNHFYFDAYNSQNCGDTDAWTKADKENYAEYEFPKFPIEEILDSDVESDVGLMLPITR
ncbi:unnamed protein product [Clonostachys solani]|uniref:Uncharacterized protein n=1 Tax=Clonostachys solani TaxID=160281 RepID=A0A9N9Z5Y4_9HYPO|nr:unnamed protein product [Clonostachys solani]